MEELKELFRAELSVLRTLIAGQSEDIAEIKEAVREFQQFCDGKRSALVETISLLQQEQQGIRTQQRLVLGGLAIVVTGAVKGLFDWLVR